MSDKEITNEPKLPAALKAALRSLPPMNVNVVTDWSAFSRLIELVTAAQRQAEAALAQQG
jgi:hypothetical protein